MFLRVSTILIAIAALGAADTLTLRSGEVVRGQYLGGDARHVKMAVGDRVETYSIEDVADLSFGGGQRLSADNDRRDNPRSPRRRRPPGQRRPRGASRPVNPAAVSGMVIPVGTYHYGPHDRLREFASKPGWARPSAPAWMNRCMVDGQTVIPRGADAVVKLVEDKQSGKIEGRTVLTLVLQQVLVNGRMVDLTPGDVSQSSGSRGARSAKVIGGTAALGAIIGALAGGGRGAAIGAGSGAAVGTGAQVLTKGQTVKIPSETRLTFTLQQPAQL